MEPPQIQVARPSVASLLLAARSAGVDLASATGFVIERRDRRYLVTNWHVLAGRRNDNGALLSATGAVPDEILIMHHRESSLGSWVPKIESLYDANDSPRWLEHPRHRRSVDVVALELRNLDGIDCYAHDPWAKGPGLATGVATGLSIIGFPFGLTGGGALGIWVQGTVASEPSVDFNRLPCFLIDSRTRPGQSGSPVIAYTAGGAVAMADGGTRVFAGAPVEQFVGVYSGRITAESDLGFVWKAAAVRDIVDMGVPGQV
jgi:Trypsin-like peptidase domain